MPPVNIRPINKPLDNAALIRDKLDSRRSKIHGSSLLNKTKHCTYQLELHLNENENELLSIVNVRVKKEIMVYIVQGGIKSKRKAFVKEQNDDSFDSNKDIKTEVETEFNHLNTQYKYKISVIATLDSNEEEEEEWPEFTQKPANVDSVLF